MKTRIQKALLYYVGCYGAASLFSFVANVHYDLGDVKFPPLYQWKLESVMYLVLSMIPAFMFCMALPPCERISFWASDVARCLGLGFGSTPLALLMAAPAKLLGEFVMGWVFILSWFIVPVFAALLLRRVSSNNNDGKDNKQAEPGGST
jgi:hypothetical protein